ncbi:MAG TPA: histidine kinase dimerization/phospho-acceptor domain-containing protein, partial [Planococcus sp. (in: firmicutes)]|nr:histidine kinase dimerization/phospho-acceptor domain-containing protein [Planococcus sp. (in: firmicutes)]
MKKIKLDFGEKNVLLLVGSMAFSMIFAFGFLHFLYKDLYLNTIRESVETQGQRTAAHYHYGELTDDIIEKIHWYNVVSDYEVIVVNELEELNDSFPFEIGQESLLAEGDQAILESGAPIMKEGYVENFQREVMGAIYPITDGDRAIGYIFIYVPLAGLSQVFGSSIPVLVVGGILFFLGTAYLINRIRKSLFKPLFSLQEMSREVSAGNYTNRLTVSQMDEIGQMSVAFNEMSAALQHQEEQKREFLSSVVHELRTPLTYIMGYAEIVKNGLYATPEEEQQYLETIELEVQRLKKLLSDLVELNHLQEDFYRFQREPIAVGQLLYETA